MEVKYWGEGICGLLSELGWMGGVETPWERLPWFGNGEEADAWAGEELGGIGLDAGGEIERGVGCGEV